MVKAPRDLQITETQSRGCCQLAMKLLFCARGDEVREAEEKKKLQMLRPGHRNTSIHKTN